MTSVAERIRELLVSVLTRCGSLSITGAPIPLPVLERWQPPTAEASRRALAMHDAAARTEAMRSRWP